MDKIKIENLEVYANHGVFEEEKETGQIFIVSLVLFVNTRVAGQTDDLKDTTDYGEVCNLVVDLMKKESFNLIETVVEKLAREVLLKFDKVEEVQVELKKPWAPIDLPLDYVSVKISRKWHNAYIGLGSNIGDKRKHLEDAITTLNNEDGCKVEKVSQFIETKPYGNVKQDDFLNACLLLKTLYTPEELLRALHRIEDLAGRVRKEKWEPRVLDLDILLYDDLVYSSIDLSIPHYDMHNRKFVLDSLHEIAPFLHFPGRSKTIREMWEEIN
jgi:dihydroneopterin aldolase/2-amino-4-hydroxy-6-hydroxymethyldihydropteridine diphosphokinase